MLPYGLAIAVSLSSFILFLTAFFMPKIHRQDDFFWSGLGFFYALVLWFCAPQIRGAVLLGQLAAVALLISYFWQVIKLREAIVNPSQQENLDRFSVTGFLGGFFNLAPKVADSQPEETSQPEEVEAVEDVKRVEGVEEVQGVERVEEAEEVSETSTATQEETTATQEENVPIAAVTEDNVVDKMVDTILETTEETTIETPESKDNTVIQSQDDTVIQSEKPNSLADNQDVPLKTETEAESEPESTTTSNISEETNKQIGLFKKLLNSDNKEQKSSPNNPSLTNTKLDELLDDNEEETKPEAMPEEIGKADPTVSAETKIEEKEVEEETNWDFLDDEAKTTPEETAVKEEELAQESVKKSREATTEQTTSVNPEKPSPNQETN